jgi:hypothetical protein
MRRSASLFQACLLGLVVSIALLGIGQSAPIPAVEVGLGSGSGEDVAAATMDRVWTEQEAPSRLPFRHGDKRSNLVRHDDAFVSPLVDLSLLTAPTAAGASLVAERLTYTPGATVSVRRHTQIRVVSLEAGSLDVRIDGVAFLDRQWPTGSLLAREPHRVKDTVHLHPGDLLVVPAEAAFTAHNSGELPAVSLEVSVRLAVPLTPMSERARAVTGAGGVHLEHLGAAIATDPGMPAAVAVARITLPPGESIVIAGTKGPAFVLVERGRFGATPDGMDVEQTPREVELFPPGERATIRTNDEVPRAVLLLTVNPAEAGPSANSLAAGRRHEYAHMRST